MDLIVKPGSLEGLVPVPGSKSHTIRGLIVGMLAGGVSHLGRPLRSADTGSCVHVCEALGARVEAAADDSEWLIHGTGGRPQASEEVVDVGNSGTTLFLAMTAAALAEGCTEFTGDEQIRVRSARPLIAALRSLGATAYSVRGTGCAPIVVGGGLDGGRVRIECPTSQYLSSLLIGCPLAGDRTTIEVPLLNERPYVQMTMAWLDEMGIRYEAAEDLRRFELPGGQRYAAYAKDVPADFSSATFFLVAAAVTGSRLFLRGLDMSDTQGDKAVVNMLKEMGCVVSNERGGISIEGPDELRGGTFDLNATPDALPGMAVAGCMARGETRLVNVPQARIKETDRIAVMARELARMGAEVEEMPDGLVLRQARLRGAEVDGHGDHRVVMALAVAGLAAEGTTTIHTAEAAAVTFPNFVELMRQAGAEMTLRP
jgi:3-phosphoshikimate 1-carboxyvinyltransferase